jgi:hypothetical protein
MSSGSTYRISVHYHSGKVHRAREDGERPDRCARGGRGDPCTHCPFNRKMPRTAFCSRIGASGGCGRRVVRKGGGRVIANRCDLLVLA